MAHRLESREQRRVDEVRKDLEIVAALVEEEGEQRLDHVFGELHVVGQIGEREFRFNHPELCHVAARVRVLGAKGRSEGVHLAQAQAVGLHRELTGHREVRLLAEEVGIEVDLPIAQRNPVQRERGDPEHVTGAFAVGTCDDRRVDVVKAALLEKIVNLPGQP